MKTKIKNYNPYVVNGGCTNFPNIQEPPLNSRLQTGDMKQIS